MCVVCGLQLPDSDVWGIINFFSVDRIFLQTIHIFLSLCYHNKGNQLRIFYKEISPFFKEILFNEVCIPRDIKP